VGKQAQWRRGKSKGEIDEREENKLFCVRGHDGFSMFGRFFRL
jgi:hypothetical protein